MEVTNFFQIQFPLYIIDVNFSKSPYVITLHLT
jgi:hypothetical protein